MHFFLSVCLIQDFSVALYPLVGLIIPELEGGFFLLAPHVLGSVPGLRSGDLRRSVNLCRSGDLSRSPTLGDLLGDTLRCSYLGF